MKKIACTPAILLLVWSGFLNAQCTGNRYHDLVFPGNPEVTLNVPYGSNLDQNGDPFQLLMDIYEPACDNATNRPLIVFAHGGGFVGGDKLDIGYVQTAEALAKLGYVVASINYRLGFPTSGLPAAFGFNSAIMRGLHDARAAVRWCRDNALNGGNTYGIDPNNIFFGGVSAGGIIALHLAYQNLQSEMNMNCGGQPGTDQSSIEGSSNNLTVPSTVKAIIAISGGIRDLNWITTNDVPVFLAHGTIDGTVPYGSGSFVIFPIHGSSSVATRCNTTATKHCFKPMYGQDHVPSNPAYVDTVATLMRNFLEHFTCGTAPNCTHNGSPVITTASVSIAITSGSNPTCSGSSVTFTATSTNGGSSPSYQWKKNGSNVGTNSATFTTTTLVNNDAITCVMTPSGGCSSGNATSNSITMSVSAGGAAAISIALTSGSNPTCTGQPLTFTATPTNGGSSPTYQWKKNGTNVGTNTTTYSSNSLVNGDAISCALTSNSSCANPTSATSNAITVTVSSSVVPAVSIALTSGSNPTCTGQPLTFTATPTNGGSSPGYQWKKNNTNVGTNSATYSSNTLANNDVISCVLTSSSSCVNPATATSNSITVTIATSVTPAVSVALTSGSNPTCTGQALTFTATATNGGSSPAYQWKKNSSNVGTNNATYSSNTLANSDVISCVLTSNSSCASSSTATSNAITITVSSSITPEVTVAITSGANPSCAGETITFTATPTNGGATPAFQWKNNSANIGTNSNAFTSASLENSDVITCEMTSSSSCASPAGATSNSVTMTIHTPPAISQSGNVLTATTAISYQWLLDGQEITGATGQTYTATEDGNYSVKGTGDCESEEFTVTGTAVLSPVNQNFIKVFPNPSAGTFRISLEGAGEYQLTLKNIAGETIYTELASDKRDPQIDISQHGKGVYLLMVKSSEGVAMTKIVIH